MSGDGVRTETAGPIARIVLDHPPANAYSLAMIRAVIAALKRAGEDDSVRAIILASALPRFFSAGLDIGALLGKSGDEVRAFLQALYIDLADVQHALGKPSIAAIGGMARGGGMTLAVSCDVILAGESASFGYPEIDVGMLPAIHYAHLPRIIGRHRAFELLFSGRTFGAAEAHRLGLVSRVVPDGELDAAALALADTFADKPATAMAIGRAAFMRQNDNGYRAAIAAAVDDVCDLVVTDEAQARLRAFVESRRARRQDKP